MTHDPQDPSPGSQEPASAGNPSWARIPAPLRNWQVTEIDGEATLVDVEDAPTDVDATAGVTRSPIADRGDAVIVLGLSPRQVDLAAGASAVFTVELLNNGQWASSFALTVEGWAPQTWFEGGEATTWPLRVTLQPGERRHIPITLGVPATPLPPAGDHPFVIVAHADRYPDRVAQVGATVTVAAHHAFGAGALRPNRSTVGWFRRRAHMQLPVSNRGNLPAALTVIGLDREHALDFVLAADTPPFAQPAEEDAPAWELALPSQSVRLTLEPGETRAVAVTVEPRRRPLVALTPWTIPYRLIVRADADPVARRTVEGRVMVQPLIGPWHLLAAAMAGVVAFFALGVSGLALLLALRNAALPAAPATAAVPEAPAVAFIIQLDQPAQTRPPDPPAPLITQPTPAQSAPAAPVVRADQITAPGEPTPAGQAPLQPVVVAPPAAPLRPASAPRAETGALTYAQMFQEIGLAYDLDWRILAAVAYVESGFDSLALSGQGDMGLMQIRPTTWREWAPAVAASDPFDSYSNVLVAARYLDYLRTLLGERGHPQTEWMLIAYNWGPEPVLNHLTAGGSLATLNTERRAYAEDVLRIARSIPAD